MYKIEMGGALRWGSLEVIKHQDYERIQLGIVIHNQGNSTYSDVSLGFWDPGQIGIIVKL